MIGGPQPAGTATRDRLNLPTGAVFDLIANVEEWTLDRWSWQYEPCWTGALYYDPICDVDSADGFPRRRSVRGESWAQTVIVVPAASRSQNEPDYSGPKLGFRCARPAAPASAD